MTAEASGRDLAVEIEDCHLPFGFGPALRQVGLERVEFAGLLALSAFDHVLPAGGAGVPLDGVPSPAQVPGDLPEPQSLGEQVVDERMMCPGAFGEFSGRLVVLAGRRVRGLPRGFDLGRRGGKVAKAGAMGGDRLLDRVGEVVRSDRGALPGLLPVGFPGPPSEPGVPLGRPPARCL
ncbi:hypothetical protein ABZX85_27670 [Streptomyces sp. NPDC004539]|uniref:hypothetical protein n=1 Tax=Streptomyces sp. NPDC004539 TaxID=3154280 RepID=UPI0033A87F46